MCFMSTPKVQPAPSTPSEDDEEVKKRKAEEERKTREQQGRRSTILTSMSGASDYGKNLKVTKLGQAGA
ncbi:hypothetical protein SAMN04488056_10312 [Cohaesibacter marisflavi]|uniref:Uncharacterized protein n=1 Tax=Cohaesibacter marisflavi TaxID=655353 RepID=A0A1I5E3K6_9HYPH|nr:hypothetical protein [Cohaesibacter marisflavi]SFO06068.1 hypothetical protein SAMN04488056_10312 [Cohaesibacter marisflavi]